MTPWLVRGERDAAKRLTDNLHEALARYSYADFEIARDKLTESGVVADKNRMTLGLLIQEIAQAHRNSAARQDDPALRQRASDPDAHLCVRCGNYTNLRTGNGGPNSTWLCHECMYGGENPSDEARARSHQYAGKTWSNGGTQGILWDEDVSVTLHTREGWAIIHRHRPDYEPKREDRVAALWRYMRDDVSALGSLTRWFYGEGAPFVRELDEYYREQKRQGYPDREYIPLAQYRRERHA
jgi:hypothetical protein